MKPKRSVNIRLDYEDYEAVKTAAMLDDRSIAQWARRALRDCARTAIEEDGRKKDG